jgi:hypothetical protein
MCFWECPQATRLLASSSFVLSVPGARVVVLLPGGGARSTRLHQLGTMFHSGASGSAAGYFLHQPLKFLIKTLLVTIIYMMFVSTLNKHMLVSVIYMMFVSTLNKRTIIVTNIMIMSFF